MSLMHLTRRAGLLAAAASLTVLLAACGDEDGSAADTPSSAAATPVADWAPVVETDADDDVTGFDFTGTPEPGAELQVATIEEGDGPVIEAGQNLTFDYFGAVYQGDAPFDESYTREPITYPIGVQQLIAGWDQGIPGLTVGSRIIMSIPPDLGYGDVEQPGLPAGSTLFFVIDLLDAQPV